MSWVVPSWMGSQYMSVGSSVVEKLTCLMNDPPEFYYKWLNFEKRLLESCFPKLRDPADPPSPRALRNEGSENHVIKSPVDAACQLTPIVVDVHIKAMWVCQ